jgi:signal transduction histidine kinase/CheY-like chemotaxis protein
MQEMPAHSNNALKRALESVRLAFVHRSLLFLLGFVALWTVLLWGYYLNERQETVEHGNILATSEMREFANDTEIALLHLFNEAHHRLDHLNIAQIEDAAGQSIETNPFRCVLITDLEGNVHFETDDQGRFIEVSKDSKSIDLRQFDTESSLRGVHTSSVILESKDEGTRNPFVRLQLSLHQPSSVGGYVHFEVPISFVLENASKAGYGLILPDGVQLVPVQGVEGYKVLNYNLKFPEAWESINAASDGSNVKGSHPSIRVTGLGGCTDGWICLGKGNRSSDLGFFLVASDSEATGMDELAQLRGSMLAFWLFVSFGAWMIQIRFASKSRNVEASIEQLRDHDSFMMTLIDTIPLPIYYRSIDGTEWGTNKSYKEEWCLGGADIPGHCEKCSIKNEAFCKSVQREIKRFTELPSKSDTQEHTIEIGGLRKELFLHMAKYGTAREENSGAICAVVDVTEFRRQEEATEKARNEANRANRAKSAFLATMSHEIRTPLNGIIGMTGLMADTALNEIQEEYIDTIRASGETLLTLINDILDFSKIEADRIDLENIAFNLEEVITETLEMLGKHMDQTSIELIYRVEPGVRTAVNGDMVRVKQVLTNLIGNAIKFTRQGSVMVSVESDPNENEEMLLISVTDTGIGISPDRINSLFDPFVQEDSSITRRFGGTGLGLAICKRLVEVMGGQMVVKSTIGEGSCFRFTLPVGKLSQTKDYDNSQARILSHLSVLMVDDNATSLKVLTEILESWKMEVHGFLDPKEGRQWLEEGNHCDIILCDQWLGEESGEDFGAHCREYLQQHQRNTPIVLLAVSNVDPDPAVFNRVILKPINRSLVLTKLVELLSHQFQGIPRMVTKGRQTGPRDFSAEYPLKILVAEDNKVNQRVVSLIFKKLGYTADFVENGQSAVEKYMEAYHESPYDVILMDIQMPILDGIQATRKIRALEEDRKCCVIALTANVLDETREEAMRSGFNDYLCKPVKIDILKSSLEHSWLYLNKMSEDRRESMVGSFFSA